MATAQMTIKATPVEHKTICLALKLYADIMLATIRDESPTEAIKKATAGTDPRRCFHSANGILEKIGY